MQTFLEEFRQYSWNIEVEETLDLTNMSYV